MFQAFVLGFWTLWSSSRDIRAVSEGLAFTIISILISMGIDFALPQIDAQWCVVMGILWAYASLLFAVVNRVAGSLMSTMLLAAAGAVGYYQLLEHLPHWVSGFMA
ncbi:multidrug transporter MatE [Neisseria musculi]|uniref:Membrane protein n=1 Tax=Neisseria musculi TaxID=1815583 RepID=A0A7H1MBF8_9NEIS|nr:multidrug transporter MatE [Neisseria musculi]QNT58973.1 putative membrane protein [Neisseria musculi]